MCKWKLNFQPFLTPSRNGRNWNPLCECNHLKITLSFEQAQMILRMQGWTKPKRSGSSFPLFLEKNVFNAHKKGKNPWHNFKILHSKDSINSTKSFTFQFFIQILTYDLILSRLSLIFYLISFNASHFKF